MKSFAVVLLLAAASPALAGTLDHPILGGTQATVGQYPTVVAIEIGGGLCTGTLLTKDWVLTAAHCVSPAVLQLQTQAQVTASARIHFGTVNIQQSQGTVVRASDTIPNPMFNENNLGASDIGLIKLATPVTDITPVPVNLVAADAPVGTAVTMVGFGATARGGGGSVGIEYVVQQTSIACQAQVGSDANLLCFSQTSGKGKCEGDSGGPSFAMIRGKMVEVGITSFGDQTCSQFGADTRVDAEKAFLLAHVPDLECDDDGDCAAMHECFMHKCIAQPFSPNGLGATCTSSADCDSGSCGSGDGGMKCTTGCTVGTAGTCPDGLDCVDAGNGAGACWPKSDDSGCAAGGSGAPTLLFGLGLAVLALRRRKQ